MLLLPVIYVAGGLLYQSISGKRADPWLYLTGFALGKLFEMIFGDIDR